jgi:hypothetical protein
MLVDLLNTPVLDQGRPLRGPRAGHAAVARRSRRARTGGAVHVCRCSETGREGSIAEGVRCGVSTRPRQVLAERPPVLAAYRVVPPFLAVTPSFDAEARWDSQGCYVAPPSASSSGTGVTGATEHTPKVTTRNHACT